jgi:D-aminoacyl-tRNA deacylase
VVAAASVGRVRTFRGFTSADVKRSQVALENPAFPARLGAGAGRVHRTFAVIAALSRVCTDQIRRRRLSLRPNDWFWPREYAAQVERPTGTAHSVPVRALVQRTTGASVRVDGAAVASIGPGLVILLGVARDDDATQIARLAERVARLRVFPNEDGRFDRSLLDIGGAALVVSQFTLYADTSAGNRPSMSQAAPPELAEPLYEAFVQALRRQGVARVETGVFGARMQVELVNDGPVTLLLEG